jgi:hypothetical protein
MTSDECSRAAARLSSPLYAVDHEACRRELRVDDADGRPCDRRSAAAAASFAMVAERGAELGTVVRRSGAVESESTARSLATSDCAFRGTEAFGNQRTP